MTVDQLSEEEECVLVNAREMSPLWSVVADWTRGGDDAECSAVVPVFTEIIGRWERAGYVEVYRSDEWPAHEAGERLTGDVLEEALRRPSTWAYREGPPVIGLLAAADPRDV
ncbi:hypothetical protein [Streptomyces hiroshimensis]|uniref:Uncharacterized protein n=1 Tax=Streptomyces hiroshimensis TaxID=66424 RepID=A0ABQ2Y6Y6_9ACTN|nr:hypothetical protein GCM10010324_14970 [Streptomyces hiroshimensis]